MPYYLKRSLKLQGVANFVAKTEGYPVQELEMRIGGILIGGNMTAQMVSCLVTELRLQMRERDGADGLIL